MDTATREIQVVSKMVEIYCRKKHSSQNVLCSQCASLLEYTQEKIRKCPHIKNKPSCRKCKIHCFSPEMRRQIKDVMIFSGPRMLWTKPIEVLRHLFS